MRRHAANLEILRHVHNLSCGWSVKRGFEMNIGSAAKAAGLPIKTVRYYADIGLVIPSARTESGYRQYTATELNKLIFARRTRTFGFSIEQTRELLSLYEDRNRSSGDVKRIASEKLEEIEAKMAELNALHDELSHLVTKCRGDDRPDCPILDDLAGREARKAGRACGSQMPGLQPLFCLMRTA